MGLLIGSALAPSLVPASQDGVVLNEARNPRYRYFQTSDGGRVAFADDTYHYRAPSGVEMFDVWVPKGTVRGLFLAGNPGGIGGDERPFTRDPGYRAFAQRFGFGLVGLHSMPGREVYSRTAKLVLDNLNDIARRGPHRELANAPLIPLGNSNGGATAYGFLNYCPDRIVCFTMNVPGWPPPEVPVDAALLVPGFICVGPNDTLIPRSVERATALMANARGRGARWAWLAEQEKGHEVGRIFDFQMVFYENCIGARLPGLNEPGGDPRKGPVRLKNLPLESGWLAEDQTWTTGLTMIAPYARYGGNRARTSWLPDADTAMLYRGLATYDNPVKVEIDGLPHRSSPASSGVFLTSGGGAVLKPGTEVLIKANAGGLPWRRIRFYDRSQLIAEIAAPARPEVRFRLPKDRAAHSFTVEAESATGEVRTAIPAHVIVSDRGADFVPKTPPLPRRSRKPLDIADGPIPTRGERQVVAYALTADHERAFSPTSKGIARFWSNVPEDGIIRLTADKNAKEGSRFHGETDAVVKVAYGRAGLYLLFDVKDESWYGKPFRGPGIVEHDTIDFLLDSRSVADLWRAPTTGSFVNAGWSISLTTNQFQLPMGNVGPSEVIQYSYADPYEFRAYQYPRAELRKAMGIVATIRDAADGRKTAEWFIPWEFVGSTGIQRPRVGMAFGFSCGYNDIDERHPGDLGQLRWINRASPWNFASRQGRNESWGEIVLGAKP